MNDSDRQQTPVATVMSEEGRDGEVDSERLNGNDDKSYCGSEQPSLNDGKSTDIPLVVDETMEARMVDSMKSMKPIEQCTLEANIQTADGGVESRRLPSISAENSSSEMKGNELFLTSPRSGLDDFDHVLAPLLKEIQPALPLASPTDHIPEYLLPERGVPVWIEQEKELVSSVCATLESGPTLSPPTRVSVEEPIVPLLKSERHQLNESSLLPTTVSKTPPRADGCSGDSSKISPEASVKVPLKRSVEVQTVPSEETEMSLPKSSDNLKYTAGVQVPADQQLSVDTDLLPTTAHRQVADSVLDTEVLIFGNVKPEDGVIKKYLDVVNQVSAPPTR